MRTMVLSILSTPMALQETVLAAWLITRGFAARQPEAVR